MYIFEQYPLQRIEQVIIVILMRKFQQSDKIYIERLRQDMHQGNQLNHDWADGDSTFDQSCYDEFHNDFLRHHKIKSIKISDSRQVQRSSKDKEFTEYQIEVRTDQLTYNVTRRFREFYGLYKKIKKLLPNDCYFPKKNYNPFVSSVHPKLVEERITKLDLFLKEVIHYVSTHKDPLVTLRLFSFIELKETYEDRYMVSKLYRKSTSENSQVSKHHSFRGHSSEVIKSKSFDENSLEMLIILINEPTNPGKHIEKLAEIIKNKKFRATPEEIKIIFMGFDEYEGVLKFGLTTVMQSNRIAALQILVDLLLPERNLLFEKYVKFLDKIPVEYWLLDDINYLESSAFKVLYFRLISIFCERAEKDSSKGEKYILKTLFLFHEDIVNDYFHWKKINNFEGKIRRANSRSMPDHILESWPLQSKISSDSGVQTLESSQKGVEAFYHQMKNTLVLRLSTMKSIEQMQEISMKWNRFVDKFQEDEYTGHYRYIMKNKEKEWNLRIKISAQSVNQTNRQSILPGQFDNEFKQFVNSSDFKIYREQSLFDSYPDFQQEIWIQEGQEFSQVLIVLKVSRDVDLFQGSLRPWALMLVEDSVVSFC